MKSHYRKIGVIFFCIFFVSTVSAQQLTPTQRKNDEGMWTGSPLLSLSEIEYELDGGGDGEIERTILGGAFGFGLGPRLDLYIEGGYIVEAELENGSDDGDGFLIGSGIRGIIYKENHFEFFGKGGVRYITEDYGSSIDGDIFELELAGVARYAVRNKLGVYGGVDLIPYSDGEIEIGRGDADIERDDLIGLRFGVEGTVNSVILNAEVALVSEEALILRATFPM
jgi:hypothetical protein